MLFLWVFGNAICAKIGNGQYLLVYVLLGVAAAIAHNLFTGGAAIGASGAINGVIGMALIWYPANSVSCAWWFFYRGGVVDIDCRFLVLIWLVFDIFGLVSGGETVAYWAHLGGLAAGVGLAVWLLKSGMVEMTEIEQSIFDLFGRSPRAAGEKEARDIRRQAAVLGSAAAAPREAEAAVAAQPAPAAEVPTSDPSPATAASEGGGTGMLEADSIKVRCKCGGKFRVAAAHVGRKGRCPKCKQVLQIQPSP